MRAAEFAVLAGRAVRAADGDALAQLLQLRGGAVERCALNRPWVDAAQFTDTRLTGTWPEVCAGVLRAGASLATRTGVDAWSGAHAAHAAAVSAFLRMFTTLSPGRWALPVLYVLLRDLRWVALGADYVSRPAGRTAGRTAVPAQRHLEDCARVLNRAFGLCAADRHTELAESRKWGTYAVANMLLATYFRLRALGLCRNVLRALSAGDVPPLDAFPRADGVTFRYYLGRLRFLDEEYAAADDELTRALHATPARAARNQERILVYLVPARLLRGVRPSRALFAAFPRLGALYAGVVAACARGDVRAYDAALRAADRVLVRLGVYLALERARAVCIAALFRRVWLVSARPTRMRLELFWRALRLVGEDAAPRDAEWYLATLIARGHVRGYIAHERQVVVLSASDPFPPRAATTF